MNQLTDSCYYHETLDKIITATSRLGWSAVRRVLIVYEDREFFLGDNCMILYRLGLYKRFFNNEATLDINFINAEYAEKYEAICRHNPYLDNLIFEEFKHIDHAGYDLVIFICWDEERFISELHDKHIRGDLPEFNFAALSLSRTVFARKKNIKAPVFPINEDLLKYAAIISDDPYELYITPPERQWANKWLEENGINKGDDLLIIVDAASNREKLLRPDVYKKVLIHLFNIPHSKILIFDNRNLQKETFYKKWLGPAFADRFIFSTALKLREELCIISSGYTKLIFGPCTGLLHCAAGVYNYFIRTGSPFLKRPVLIAYTGPWDAQFWWGNSTLVNCLLLRKHNGEKKLAVLNELTDKEKKCIDDRLSCNEYTPELITNYIDGVFSSVDQAII